MKNNRQILKKLSILLITTISTTLTQCEKGCDACTNNVCTSCKIGYRLNTGSCDPCKVSNCDTCPLDVLICEKCTSSYTKGLDLNNPNTQGCIKCIKGCDSCTDNKTCKTCSTFYRLNDRQECETSTSLIFVIVGVMLSVVFLFCLLIYILKRRKMR